MTLAVRGPLTRRRFLELGYPCPDVYGDPAILMPLYYSPRSTCGRPIGMVPHYVHYEEARRIYGEDDDISIIDARQPVEAVIDAILSCDSIISSSLHGLIIAHSYGRSAARATFAETLGGDGVKFQDYYQAGGITDAPDPLTLSMRVPTQEIRSFIQRSPTPDLDSLRSQLMDSCPF